MNTADFEVENGRMALQRYFFHETDLGNEFRRIFNPQFPVKYSEHLNSNEIKYPKNSKEEIV